MTGSEFCELPEIDYDEIVRARRNAQPENVRYFLSVLVKIDEVRVTLQDLQQKPDGQDR